MVTIPSKTQEQPSNNPDRNSHFLLIRSQSKLRTSNPNPYTKLPPTFADMERKEVKGS